MIEILKDLDTILLLFFNNLNNPFFDFIFYWISDKWIWIPFYMFLAWKIYKFDRKNVIVIILFITAAITISDQVASSVIKELVMRLRPCHNPEIASEIHLVNNYCGGKYGFVSSHAANVFALSAFITRLFKGTDFNLHRIIWIWAFIVSYSRIYLGVHYPGDVIGGAIVGLAAGLLVVNIYFNFIKSIKKK